MKQQCSLQWIKLQHENSVHYVILTQDITLLYMAPPDSNTEPLCCQDSLLTTNLLDLGNNEHIIY